MCLGRLLIGTVVSLCRRGSSHLRIDICPASEQRILGEGDIRGCWMVG